MTKPVTTTQQYDAATDKARASFLKRVKSIRAENAKAMQAKQLEKLNAAYAKATCAYR